MSMLGNQESYNLNAKAAESHGLLRFVEHLLHEYADVLPGLDPDMSRKLTLLQERRSQRGRWTKSWPRVSVSWTGPSAKPKGLA